MAHIQQNFEGTALQEWELAHGIVRKVRGGCEYVVCTDLPRFIEQTEREAQERKNREIAEALAEAYLPTGGMQ